MQLNEKYGLIKERLKIFILKMDKDVTGKLHKKEKEKKKT